MGRKPKWLDGHGWPRKPSAQRGGHSRPSMAFAALGLLPVERGDGAAGACYAGAHPLPNPSPIKGEGLKRAPLPLWERSDGQEPKWLEGHGRPREPSA